MSEEKIAGASGTPQAAFRLQKLYIKDLSFENPGAPEIFFMKEAEPKVDLKLGLKNRKLDDDHWEISLAITAKVTDVKSDKTMFVIEVEHAGAFLLKNIPEEHMAAVLAVECPNVMFPFTRQVVSQTSVDGGFMPFLMEPINFLAMYENSRKTQQEKEKGN